MEFKTNDQVIQITIPKVGWVWQNIGTIIQITEEFLICEILVDGSRIMKFYRKDGRREDGETFIIHRPISEC